jgi:hypothetical protein
MTERLKKEREGKIKGREKRGKRKENKMVGVQTATRQPNL